MGVEIDRNAQIIQGGLYGIAALCILAAIGHSVWPSRLDDKTAMFLGLAAAVLIIREISKIEFPGVKIERVRQELKKEVQQVDKKVEMIESGGLLPGRAEPAQRVLQRSVAHHTEQKDQWDTDPNKGKFGGLAEVDGRKLTATIKPAAGPSSSACKVRLSVKSTDGSRPLKGSVTFFLHPTFKERKQYDVPVVNGVAQDEIISWGRFTVGAVADDGKTKLELDLAEVEGGTPKFYAQ